MFTFARRCLFFLFLANVTLGATYYVAKDGNNNNPGSESLPWLTIKYGSKQLSADDTLIVKEGIYEETLYDVIPPGSDWDHPVTLKVNLGDNVTIKPPVSSTSYYVINLIKEGYYREGILVNNVTKKYIIIEGFILDAENVIYCALNMEFGAEHIRVKDCEIKNSPLTAIYVGTTSHNNEFINLNVHNNGLTEAPPFGHGIYITGDDNIVEGGAFYDNMGGGIHIYHTFNPNNPVYPDNNMVRNSIVYNNHVGIYLWSGTNNICYNNIVYDNSSVGISVNDGTENNGQKVYNNTVYNNGGYGVEIWSSAAMDAMIENNIICSNGQYQFQNIIDSGTGTILENNFTYDPSFVDAVNHDFHLNSDSGCIDQGTTLNEVTVDKEGISRPQGSAYDIGAYEKLQYLVSGTVSYTPYEIEDETYYLLTTATVKLVMGGTVGSDGLVSGGDQIDSQTLTFDGSGTDPQPYGFMTTETGDAVVVIERNAQTGWFEDFQSVTLGTTTTADLALTHAMPGDADMSDFVDEDDYNLWFYGYQNSLSGWEYGDFDGSGVVDGDDYSLWLYGYQICHP